MIFTVSNQTAGGGTVNLEPAQRCLELFERELRPKPVHDARRQIVDGAELEQLRGEARLVEVAGRCAPTADQSGSRFVEPDAGVGIENAGAKLDRRQMSLAHGPQAHDEALRAARETALVRRRHDRRVEQCCGLDRVLVREVGADQQPTIGRHRRSVGDVHRQRLELPLQHLAKMPMAPIELPHDRHVQRSYFGLWNRQDPRHQ